MTCLVAVSRKFLPLTLFIAAMFLIVNQSLDAQPPGHQRERFERLVPGFELKNETMFQAIGRFYEATGIVVSVEKPLDSGENIQPDREFSSKIAGGRPQTVLDEICALDPQYTWSRDDDMVNIYPASTRVDASYVFNRQLPTFRMAEVEDAATAAIQAVRQSSGVPTQLLVMEAGDYTFEKPWTVSFTGLTVRQAMNRIAVHLCGTCGWQLTGARATPTVIFYRRLTSSPLK